jgi:5-methylcytosine-specific restriction endonuclease McrA
VSNGVRIARPPGKRRKVKVWPGTMAKMRRLARWKGTRDAFIYLKDGRCDRCGDRWLPELLDLHHVVSAAKGGAWDVSNAELLCVDCHFRHHYVRGDC